MSRAHIQTAKQPITGIIELPGDKSISHRRALLSMFVEEDVRLLNFADGEDCAATLQCLERLGKKVLRTSQELILSGNMTRSGVELDCRNSGTTARVLMGLLAGREGRWLIHGDASLSRRPMQRVIEPLQKMGAEIELNDGFLPARVVGSPLHGITYESPVPSAQVKTAVLLAGLHADGITRYREPLPSRDHTERLLGIVKGRDGWLTLDPTQIALTDEMLSSRIPGDVSSASFWIAATLLRPGSQIRMPHTLISPTRSVHVQILKQAGAAVEFKNEAVEHGEAIANIALGHAPLQAFTVAPEQSALLVDEIPALAVIATGAQGRNEFHNLTELRFKESDRYTLITEGLRRMGAQVETWGDGFAITGPTPLRGTAIETNSDHRIAMAFAIAGLAAQGETIIADAECVAVSYPKFWDRLARLAPGSVKLEG